MIARILWSFVLVASLYFISIFAFPKQADEVGDMLGIRNFNFLLREMKTGFATEEMPVPQSLQDLQTGSGLLQDARETIGKTKAAIETTRSTIETKVEQTKKVVNSVEKTTTAISELQQNVKDLTSITGSATPATAATWSVVVK